MNGFERPGSTGRFKKWTAARLDRACTMQLHGSNDRQGFFWSASSPQVLVFQGVKQDKIFFNEESSKTAPLPRSIFSVLCEGRESLFFSLILFSRAFVFSSRSAALIQLQDATIK